MPVRPRAHKGSILVVILVFLALMSLFSLACSQTVLRLERELKQIEQKQLRKYEAPIDR